MFGVDPWPSSKPPPTLNSGLLKVFSASMQARWLLYLQQVLAAERYGKVLFVRMAHFL